VAPGHISNIGAFLETHVEEKMPFLVLAEHSNDNTAETVYLPPADVGLRDLGGLLSHRSHGKLATAIGDFAGGMPRGREACQKQPEAGWFGNRNFGTRS
jgi:hypothetical protein